MNTLGSVLSSPINGIQGLLQVGRALGATARLFNHFIYVSGIHGMRRTVVLTQMSRTESVNIHTGFGCPVGEGEFIFLDVAMLANIQDPNEASSFLLKDREFQRTCGANQFHIKKGTVRILINDDPSNDYMLQDIVHKLHPDWDNKPGFQDLMDTSTEAHFTN